MREFNITGNCIPSEHYMVSLDEKVKEVRRLLSKKKYFTVNRARQYGKTTLLSGIFRECSSDYTVLRGSFESFGESGFKSEKAFVNSFTAHLSERLEYVDKSLSEIINKKIDSINTFRELSKIITKISKISAKPIVLTIDEIDKNCKSELFLNFLSMLREKYLLRNDGLDFTFHSVILVGIHDIKNIKLKIRSDDEIRLNSPWNIAVDFKLDMSFSAKEIEGMLIDYKSEQKLDFNEKEISEIIYRYTRGYPFLVSRICKIIDEDLNKIWSEDNVDESIKLLLDEKNTLFDDLIKNLENRKDLYKIIYEIIVLGIEKMYNTYSYEIGFMYGILRRNKNRIEIHNEIYETLIYNYMVTQYIKENGEVLNYKYRTNFLNNMVDPFVKTIF
jgi:hypothetical protein